MYVFIYFYNNIIIICYPAVKYIVKVTFFNELLKVKRILHEIV